VPVPDRQNDLYQQAAAEFGPALARLARAYEADSDQQRDLLQEIHFGLWRSFSSFNGACSLRTWVYRVAHNTGASHMLKRQKLRLDRLTTLDALADAVDADNPAQTAEDGETLARLTSLIHTLKPPDRQLILLYLEGVDAQSIGEICGMSAAAVAMRVHRLKAALSKRFGRK